MLMAGLVGGAVWGAIPALLKTRFNVNETLSSLMMTYVAIHLMNYLVTGPWKDRKGFSLPADAAAHRRPDDADADPGYAWFTLACCSR